MSIHNMLEQAVAAQQAGAFSDAIRLYGLVLTEQPTNAVANYNLGVLSAGMEDFETALILFRNAIDANVEEKQYWLSYIDTLLRAGRLEDARRIKEEASARGIIASE